MPMNYQAIREKEIAYCKDNIEYSIDTYGHIEDRDTVDLVQPFKMYPAQREALKSITTHRKNIILKARQLGLTWLVMHIAAHLLLCNSGRKIIGLSKTEEEAKELVRRLALIFRYMPELIAEKGYEPEGWNGITFYATALTLTLVFPTGKGEPSVFNALASGPGAGRSFTADMIIVDEWAFQQFAREIYEGIYPTINRPNGGIFIGLSTIARGTLFEEIYTTPDNGFNKIFIPWYADPKRNEKWYEDTKRDIGDAITAEYPATVEEALMVPGGAFFPEVRMDTHVTKDEIKGELRRYCAIDYGLDALAAIWIAIDTKGREQAYRYLKEKSLTISQAAEMLLSRSAYERVDAFLAPDDLWSRRQETGKSAAAIFSENDVHLTKVNRDMFNGCMAMKEHLRVREDGTPKLTFLYGTCDSLIKDLQKIQKDKNKPTVYSKDPHELTHGPDALRYFSTWWTSPARESEKAKREKRWTPDMLADWDNAGEELRSIMRERYGEPVR